MSSERAPPPAPLLTRPCRYRKLRSGPELLRRSGLTERWRRRQLSNFEYLMQLNTLAGRTYNDLNQYPVFPWIVADMDSAVLDLEDPASFRDLSRPVGALNPDRCEMLKAMHDGNDDPLMGRFHYGTHYSSAAFVLHYLVRYGDRGLCCRRGPTAGSPAPHSQARALHVAARGAAKWALRPCCPAILLGAHHVEGHRRGVERREGAHP